MQKINRDSEILTGLKDLETLHSIEKFPIFMGCTSKPKSEDLFAEQTWQISKNNGIIQLKSLLPLEILYPEHHNAGIIGNTWIEHHKKFGEFILKFGSKSILEIGGSHGILAKYCMEKKKLKWTILEPNPIPIKNCKAKFIKGFFDNKFINREPIDAIVHSHVFEHIYSPLDFMKEISNKLDINQRLMFSIPNMNVMLKKKYTNCLNFEHTFFINESLADYLVTSNNFFIQEKKYFKDDHSIFYSCIKKNNVKTKHLPKNSYEENKKSFNEFISYHTELVRKLNSNIDKKKEVFLFGAHIFSQYLIMLGLSTKNIKCILDNDKDKQNKRLYGTDLFVKSPKSLKEISNPLVILKAGTYNDEIKEDILKNINSNTDFI